MTFETRSRSPNFVFETGSALCRHDKEHHHDGQT